MKNMSKNEWAGEGEYKMGEGGEGMGDQTSLNV
jgi:hypothetical protein